MPETTQNGTGMAGLLQKPWFFPLAFVLAALVLYWPSRNAGFVMDWLGWQYAYDRGGWAGIPGSFGYPGLHPVLHLGNYILYWLFGANSPAWYLVFAGLHGINAWLLCRLALRLPLQLPASQTRFIGVGAGLLFLLSPYAVETVVWRVCLHYLLALMFALLALHSVLDDLYEEKKYSWWKVQGLVLLALFTFEWSLVIPVLLLTLVVIWHFSQKISRPLLPVLGRLLAPQIGLWAIYFLINKLRIGDWVGHYGAETHLNLRPAPIITNMLRYSVKQFGFMRHWEHPVKVQVFDGLEAGWPFWLGAGFVAAFAAIWMIYFRRLSPRLQWAGASMTWFFIALLPVSNLYFYYLMYSENDRYGYFASGFGWLALMLLLSFLPKILSRLVALALIALSLLLTVQMNRLWSDSEKVYDSLVRDFRWYDRDEVIILCSPDNYQGVFMFRIIGQLNGFNEALELRRHKPFAGKMWEAAQFNMVYPEYGINAERDSSGLVYKVSFKQDGNWWWRNGIGAIDYETDRYVFRKKEWHMEVELKEKRPNTAVIYPSGGHWKEVID